MLSDGILDEQECADLLETLNSFSRGDFEFGEVLKAASLPLCSPAPQLTFPGQKYCFTGTFRYGKRKDCEQAVLERQGSCGPLSKQTDILVIGLYATESWKHSSFGNKILRASAWRAEGIPISIVSEENWGKHL